MALRVLGADGLGEEPSKRHRVDLWISVMSVELDHLVVGGDSGAIASTASTTAR